MDARRTFCAKGPREKAEHRVGRSIASYIAPAWSHYVDHLQRRTLGFGKEQYRLSERMGSRAWSHAWARQPSVTVGSCRLEERSLPYPHLLVEGIGEVSGRVRLYASRISGGKAEEIDVSNGFFVNIRGRVLKPEDPYFGLEGLSPIPFGLGSEPLSVLMGSMASSAVNRESVSDSVDLRIFVLF